jgi:hypothetical protein
VRFSVPELPHGKFTGCDGQMSLFDDETAERDCLRRQP